MAIFPPTTTAARFRSARASGCKAPVNASDYQLDAASGAESFGSVEVPFAADLRVNFDWKVSGRITLFAEGRNLINRRLYQYPWYPEYGANFTVGVKANF